jgi:hypothetical protein
VPQPAAARVEVDAGLDEQAGVGVADVLELDPAQLRIPQALTVEQRDAAGPHRLAIF